jgi:hypothetical protein
VNSSYGTAVEAFIKELIEEAEGAGLFGKTKEADGRLLFKNSKFR